MPGEDLPHVSHLYREGHEAFDQDVVVIGGGNSAAEAALDLWRAGARVTLAHFGPTFDKKIKPWVQPDFENRDSEGSIDARWNSRVTAIERGAVVVTSPAGEERLRADRVYVMTGFAPNVDLLRQIGVPIDAMTGVPAHDDARSRRRSPICSSPALSSRDSTPTRCSSRTGAITAIKSWRDCSANQRRRSPS